MDEWTLNDLLECSVCLERLDTSSKVLPCQHTFCKKCLEDILTTNKELRCPECRVLVEVKIEDLPPNVLLMRILEGMRNAGPKKRNSLGSVRQPSSLPPTLSQPHSTPEPTARVLPLPHAAAATKIPSQPYARAVYDYLSKEPGDLSFKKGDLIMLRKKIDNNWYLGESGGKQGVFPLSYVQIMTPLPSHIPQCKALYDFRMTNDDEEGCLTFNKGEVITVIRRVDENWAEGKLNDRIGIFPLAFVEMNSVARALMKLSTNSQPGPSRLAPPTPTMEDATPLIPTDHSHNTHPAQPQSLPQPQPQSQSQVHQPQIHQPQIHQPQTHQPQIHQPQTHQPQLHQPQLASDSSSSTTLTSPSSSSPATSSSSTAPSSPTSPPPPVLHHPHNRHSAEILSPTDISLDSQSNGVEGVDRLRRTSEIPPPQGSPHSALQLPAAYVALYPYKPQKADELELKRGSVYTVTERCQDGWFKGTASRSHKCGVFPGNYVAPAKSLSALQAQVRGLSLTIHKTAPLVPVAVQPHPRSYTRQSPAPAPTQHNTSGSQSQDGGSPQRLAQSTTVNSPPNTTVVSPPPRSTDKVRDKKSVSLMRRLTSMKKSRSPPPSYSMDNPVFEDGSVTTTTPTHTPPVHVRSGSCPSQLLQALPLDGSSPHHRLRSRHKDRNLTPHHSRGEVPTPVAVANPTATPTHTHRKSNSLDGSDRKSKQLVPPVRERFRCIVAYPPNSEYELELRVGDVIYVHRKREDGWYKGTQQRTGKTGLFPASFVESF
ncbi:E3 ubiquitin-protein ligase SH3RF1 isoform X2 [Macrosteles quadrilineatus]|uniref:E3 ubiquitin-protein ligase SH3RF1 isoform X2 n=1 Tax=Macrosteles quadrilineatus TaxID=74068 RepID=UPI0023E27D0C|nr:E3 ubiquitin-protein ligase SH3RF1 isoform X2 [Macrosteles quadrilineatus]